MAVLFQAAALFLREADMDEQPYCLAMLLCDLVYRDSATGKVTILGAFNKLTTQIGGGNKARFWVYTALTDGRGKIALNLKIRHAESDFDDSPNNEVETPLDPFEIEFTNPLMVFEGVFVLDCEFKKEGVYFCELYAGSERITSRRLIIEARVAE